MYLPPHSPYYVNLIQLLLCNVRKYIYIYEIRQSLPIVCFTFLTQEPPAAIYIMSCVLCRPWWGVYLVYITHYLVYMKDLVGSCVCLMQYYEGPGKVMCVSYTVLWRTWWGHVSVLLVPWSTWRGHVYALISTKRNPLVCALFQFVTQLIICFKMQTKSEQNDHLQ